jgi:hypothetical protein
MPTYHPDIIGKLRTYEQNVTRTTHHNLNDTSILRINSSSTVHLKF